VECGLDRLEGSRTVAVTRVLTFTRYLVRRALFALLLVGAVSSGALLLTLLAPGDFATELAFDADPLVLARRRAELGLDRPMVTQYLEWISRAVRLDFGHSLLYTRPVGSLVLERALNTALLASAALALATLLGVPFGIYTGIHQRGAIVRIIRTASLVLLSTPPLLASLALVILAARTGWLPLGGMVSAAAADAPLAEWLADVARHLPLPTLALALPLAAVLERLQSTALGEAVQEPFVQAARARGLSSDRAMIRHGWRVSLGTVLGLYGVIIGSLFSGSFIVEVVTAWPGLGRLMFDALRARDLYLVAGCAAAGALFLALGTLVADLLHAAADPRTRVVTRR
jgi:peptide/nickel transport system permease protein